MKITACLAISIDGKISPPTDGPFKRMGSDEDINHLKRLRDTADAIVFGASTFRAYQKTRFGLSQKIPPVHCILTQSFDLPLDAPLFEDASVPTLIFSSAIAPDSIKTKFPSHIEWHLLDQKKPAASLLSVLSAFKKRSSVQTVQVEGGGYIVPLFLNEQLLDEIYLTLCPLLLGNRSDIPALISSPLSTSLGTELLSVKQLGNELYLHYRCQY